MHGPVGRTPAGARAPAGTCRRAAFIQPHSSPGNAAPTAVTKNLGPGAHSLLEMREVQGLTGDMWGPFLEVGNPGLGTAGVPGRSTVSPVELPRCVAPGRRARAANGVSPTGLPGPKPPAATTACEGPSWARGGM